jgi:hypothetical protein
VKSRRLIVKHVQFFKTMEIHISRGHFPVIGFLNGTGGLGDLIGPPTGEYPARTGSADGPTPTFHSNFDDHAIFPTAVFRGSLWRTIRRIGRTGDLQFRIRANAF